MQKKLVKESFKFLKLLVVGLLLVIIVILAGEALQAYEIVILAITPYILYQIYTAVHKASRKRKR